MPPNQPTQPQQLQLNPDPEILKGRYANNLMIGHTTEEFILDFMLLAPPVGQYVARIITSPGHLKRIIAALQQNLKGYEDQFGVITVADQPNEPGMGFHR